MAIFYFPPSFFPICPKFELDVADQSMHSEKVQIHYFSDIKKSLSIFIADVDIMNVKTCGSKVFKIETQIKVKSKNEMDPH